VVALDIFSDHYGIDGNTPERLRTNVAAAGAADRLEVQTADMRQMPFPDASFDGAVSAYAIDHLNRDGITRALAETRRVLKPGGDFLLLVLNPDVWIRVALPMFYEHGYFGRQPPAEVWRERLVTGGFDVVEVGTTPGTLYLLGRTPAGAASRSR
jgi:SAM-dependent methyltransferase